VGSSGSRKAQSGGDRVKTFDAQLMQWLLGPVRSRSGPLVLDR
jgi:hypothetical protein